ncbi:multidrug ABC transporter ATP-binding protein [Saccharomonospora piscinae]|uniref:Multidrug ABC transporter ATP-binding protein n=1 Tax=Saccharomonospora piscinae TaxID=687388 RepID=A0A1V9A1A9_SACPI|nr:ABC transporter ATP-binding protein [Saccharomonospora piscinae]OQO90927.1 multidrug ABC transporter ATP-binding protein [Saccharomonospora piscinae]
MLDSALRRAIHGQGRRLSSASVLASLHQGCEAAVPVLVGVVIDEAVSTGSQTALAVLLAALAAVFTALSLSYRFAARIAERAAEHAAHELRVAITNRVVDPCGGAETGRLPGALVSIATTDARKVGTLNGALPFGIAALAGIAVSAVALLRISVPLGLLVLLGTPPLLWLSHLVGRPLERRSGAEAERAAHASGVAADLVAGLRVLKGIGAEAAAVARYRRTSRDALAATLRAARAHAGHDGAILALTGVFIAVVALVGAHLAAAGSLTVGGLVAAVGLAQYLLGPFQIIAWVGGQLARARASAHRIDAVLSARPAVVGGTRQLPPGTPAELGLRGLTHGTLRGLDLRVAPGTLLGVVTAEQAVADDLVRCLGREAEPEGGAVTVGGVPVTEFDPGLLRRCVLTAAHDADLFEGSVADNVGGDPATVHTALTASAADEVVAALPDGAHTRVAERGRSLSGGQRQRVALARALARDSPVLVLHDPTTAVDAVTEARIATALRDARAGRTTVLVTTSPALLAVTDRVVYLRDGRVHADGTHAALLAGDPAYRAAVLS